MQSSPLFAPTLLSKLLSNVVPGFGPLHHRSSVAAVSVSQDPSTPPTIKKTSQKHSPILKKKKSAFSSKKRVKIHPSIVIVQKPATPSATCPPTTSSSSPSKRSFPARLTRSATASAATAAKKMKMNS